MEKAGPLLAPSARGRQKEQEEERLKALHRYNILDTPTEEEFDHIVELASEICNTPIAMISFIDRERQWIKAEVGLEIKETPREDAFCNYCIENDDGKVLEIQDASLHPDFQENPFVAGGPKLRFYAGAPMIDSKGNKLGSVCILDYKPRTLGSKERFLLKTLAEQVVRNLETEADKKELQRSHVEMEQSLSYAKRIQNALFQPLDRDAPHSPEHFVYLKPLTDVSGDFYWAKEHEGYFYIAAMDCTGHGVPGGFMSMLGVSFLNEVLSESGPLMPGEILDQVRQRIIRELKGDDPLSGARDGMDAAILRIPISEGRGGLRRKAVGSNGAGSEQVEVQFAGAQNPLYVVRQGIGKEDPTAIGDLIGHYENPEGSDQRKENLLRGRIRPFKGNSYGIEIKGDRKPVAYHEFPDGGFGTVSLKLQKEDMLYIFSDGFPDQFGGPRGKKFQYGNFKHLLTELHQDPLKVQKERLDRGLETWRKSSDQDQIDDVLVVGIRL